MSNSGKCIPRAVDDFKWVHMSKSRLSESCFPQVWNEEDCSTPRVTVDSRCDVWPSPSSQCCLSASLKPGSGSRQSVVSTQPDSQDCVIRDSCLQLWISDSPVFTGKGWDEAEPPFACLLVFFTRWRVLSSSFPAARGALCHWAPWHGLPDQVTEWLLGWLLVNNAVHAPIKFELKCYFAAPKVVSLFLLLDLAPLLFPS